MKCCFIFLFFLSCCFTKAQEARTLSFLADPFSRHAPFLLIRTGLIDGPLQQARDAEKKKDRLRIDGEYKKGALKKTSSEANLALAGIALMLIIAVLIYQGYKSKLSGNLRLEIKQREIDQKNANLNELLLEKDKLLEEKEWLVEEVRHRVKNNLQVIMSLLNTQAAFLKNKAAVYALRESQNRIEAIALAHQELYTADNVSMVSMPNYITELTDHIKENFNTSIKGIRFEQFVEPIDLDIGLAMPIGLILNEGITNAIKYAFPKGDGLLSVRLHNIIKGLLLLEINDNGVGLSDDFTGRNVESLGMEMMKALSKQLEGTFKVVSCRGLQITVIFQY